MNLKKEAVWLSLSTIRGVILNNVIAIFTIDNSLSPARGSYSQTLFHMIGEDSLSLAQGELF